MTNKKEEDDSIEKFARFRADPKEIRIRLRHVDGQWLAKIHPAHWNISHGHVPQYVGYDVDAKKAVLQALEEADDRDMKGIDLSLEWAYAHPFGEAGVKQRTDKK